MTVSASLKIQNLKIIDPVVVHDFRGEYIETYNQERYKFYDSENKAVLFVEDDISRSRQGVLRGLHGDDRTWKLVQCLYGAIYEVVVDMREQSPTYLAWEAFTINDKNRQQLLIPAGCANGHLVLTPEAIFSYKQSQFYSGAVNQFTVRWNDPAIGIYWPISNPIISQRDATAEAAGRLSSENSQV